MSQWITRESADKKMKTVTYRTSMHYPPGMHVFNSTAYLNKVPPNCGLRYKHILFSKILRCKYYQLPSHITRKKITKP